MSLKKIKLITIACIVFMISMLAIGCTNSSSSREKMEEASKTRTVKTVKGDIEVPVNPKRIVINYFQGDLLALGVKPIAMNTVGGKTAFEEELKDVKEIEKWEPEEVMALEPDLIIVIDEEQYEKLHKIAPTILVPFTEMSAKERLTLIGDAVGKQEEAKKLLNDFDKKIEESKQKLEKAGIMDKTFTLLENNSGKVWVFGNKWGRGGEVFYDYLDLKAPDIIEKEIIDGDQYRELSLEALPEYCGDFIIKSVWDEKDNLKDNNLWKNISAVKEDRVITTNAELYYYMDIYSMNAQLDIFVNDILKTIKK
ncbi:ABC transporter substrate-binding protein [Clostridioides mangenotii]|uniref:ABC transporter substrate-binding protein n=1 Tax=Metaclostridioides mangenotii TaxID=1540 RepID=UPI001C101479|nr:ABC transporter substrate-binding protein [Clostridioides mangenotii]MBU5307449.1 ABC transporter substrate-binding protein [Clostridioides mangenotii]